MLARMHAGYQTIDDAAAKCGLTRQNWSNWEKGMKPRDLVEVVQAISDGLDIDRDWLLFGGPLSKPASGVRRRQSGATVWYRPNSRGSTRHRPNGRGARAVTTGATQPTSATHRPPGRDDTVTPASRIRRPAIRAQRLSA
jgi:transcriptional regulator with XRE-family HTH domain